MRLELIIKHCAELLQQKEKTYTAKLGYAISRNIKALQEAVNEYDESRIQICKNYANKDENGKEMIKDGHYDMTEENEKIVNEELLSLQMMDVDVAIMKVPFSELEECEKKERYTIPSVSDIEALMFMIED